MVKLLRRRTAPCCKETEPKNDMRFQCNPTLPASTCACNWPKRSRERPFTWQRAQGICLKINLVRDSCRRSLRFKRTPYSEHYVTRGSVSRGTVVEVVSHNVQNPVTAGLQHKISTIARSAIYSNFRRWWNEPYIFCRDLHEQFPSGYHWGL